jgi:hypothetical protein
LEELNRLLWSHRKLDRYNIRYVGKERIDDLDLFIFDVSPKVMPDPKKIKERLFSGTNMG